MRPCESTPPERAVTAVIVHLLDRVTVETYEALGEVYLDTWCGMLAAAMSSELGDDRLVCLGDVLAWMNRPGRHRSEDLRDYFNKEDA